jgi:bacteriochlorophyllide a dehydrogenase
LDTIAVLLREPERLELGRVDIVAPGDTDVVVDVDWSGISTGTERLLWEGRMPHFPGMGYPLVPGYESVGRIAMAGRQSGHREGDRVFVAGARCFAQVRGLFGAAAARLVVPGPRATVIDPALGERGILLALAATAQHALAAPGARLPELIVGHGVLGRLIARITVAIGGPPPIVWERNPQRQEGAEGYRVCDPSDDSRNDYAAVYDASGDATLLPSLITRLAAGGEVVLAGFYAEPLTFPFVPAFMREARLRVAAEWQPADMQSVINLLAEGRLSLDGLITHRERAHRAPSAYRTAFTDPNCLKMILEWSANA